MNVDAVRGATQLKNHAKEDDFNGRRRSTCKCWRTACSVDFSVQEAGGCPLKAARRKILKATWLCSLGTCRRTACERDCRGGGICCAGASACALKVAHRNTPHVLFKGGVHISCVFTLFLSFMICSSRTGHPTAVFRSNRVCSSRTCAQANSACLGTECLHVSRHQSSWWLVFFRAQSGRAVAYFHIPKHVCSYTFTIQVRLSEERAKDDVDVGPDADT